ncbi:MAG: NAD(P)-dependent alcohol dehydrogenase [Planctomycetaceae bacterium]|jgi:uncharacterized zinc-type alcohol dehydrogenase-like protein|nr:NAD(P)-dependent alcohol dehydrogenase [Planctomycetaceae bacterium]
MYPRIITTFIIIVCLYAPVFSQVHSHGLAVTSSRLAFVPYNFERRNVGENDVLIDILYTGICHTDVHFAKGDFIEGDVPDGYYPLVPGHEIVGRVREIGKSVTKFKVGDYAGVGCLVDSCGECEQCRRGEEQYCAKLVPTYAGVDKTGQKTYGGFSDCVVVTERFAMKIPATVPLERVAPLLCAGITTYSPLKYNNVRSGSKVAVAGFGGLGHLAVKYAVAMGAEVTVFDVVESKRQFAADIGAKRFVNTRNADELLNTADSFDLILNTIPVNHDVEMYVKMLRIDGTMVILGVQKKGQVPTIHTDQLFGRRKIYGSLIGGTVETQEMLDFSAKHKIFPDVEIINNDAKTVDKAFENLDNGKAPFRYVIKIKP